jgi:hypothetical protein
MEPTNLYPALYIFLVQDQTSSLQPGHQHCHMKGFPRGKADPDTMGGEVLIFEDVRRPRGTS